METEVNNRPEEGDVRPLVEELDARIDKTDAAIMIRHFRPYDSYELLGNRLGLLRLGVELLKAGLNLPPTGKRPLIEELAYLWTEPGHSLFCASRNDELRNTIRKPEKEETACGWIAIPMMLLGTFWLGLCALCFFVGFYTVAKWVFTWYYTS
jgi:hypothetical protein